MNACTLNPTDSRTLAQDHEEMLFETADYLNEARQSMIRHLPVEQRKGRLGNLRVCLGTLQHLETEFHNFELLSLVHSLEETAEDLINTDTRILNSVLRESGLSQRMLSNAHLHSNAPKKAS